MARNNSSIQMETRLDIKQLTLILLSRLHNAPTTRNNIFLEKIKLQRSPPSLFPCYPIAHDSPAPASPFGSPGASGPQGLKRKKLYLHYDSNSKLI